ncbi:type II toxin-antitoxin system HicA family toxin [Synechococcus sp. CBW1107]|uniref:type II toxin-antitoxin system HicA family toxin n=1 Tax=Synechococcus sp. CBW1107 TaxID=2789857 RepID=UPI002AD27DB6|nr:type II toxin-antitoxin system HicA family toxin [Synechococcus sp. CBW1107]
MKQPGPLSLESPRCHQDTPKFKHPYRSGRVTVAVKPGDEVAPGTLNSISKQAGVDL